MPPINRRDFLRTTAVAGAALAAGPLPAFAQDAPKSAEPVMIALIGAGGRGMQLTRVLAGMPDVAIKYVCDVDAKRAALVAKAATAHASGGEGGPGPTPLNDFRKALDDKDVAAVVIATPDHWHTPAAILACAAGKHAYVEKPCCHNPHEGELLLAAAKKYGRCMQHGTQRRSVPRLIEAIEKVRSGAIGKVILARGWYTNARKSIGRGNAVAPPENLDWTLWQGPAPQRDFHDNYVPYNWHWFWHWGTGECGNNGTHSIDLCRWGLDVTTPMMVTSSGGRYHYDDDWETPDTQFVTFDFGDKVIEWEGRSCDPHGMEGNNTFGATFYGSAAALIVDGGGYAIVDPKGKQLEKYTGPLTEHAHLQNFLDAARANDPSKLNAPIGEGVASTMLCHLANISQRVGRTLHIDRETGHIAGDDDAAKLWTREYQPGWEPKV